MIFFDPADIFSGIDVVNLLDHQYRLDDMKKRITSLERVEYAFPATVRIDLQPQPVPKHHKHEARCQLPKPPKKQRISLKKLVEPYKQQIKQFPNPILNQLRQLISNIINSSDRIASYLDRELHNCALNLYSNDRIKLIEYLNSLVIREIKIDTLKTSEDKQLLPKPKQVSKYESGGDYLLDQLKQLRKTVDGEMKKKRSKSAFNDYQAKMEKQLGEVKSKVEELERTYDKIQKSSIIKPQDGEMTSFIKLYNKLNQINQKEPRSTKTNPENSQDYNNHFVQSEGSLPKAEVKYRQEPKPITNSNQVLSLKLKLQQMQKDKQTLKFKYLELTEQVERLKNSFVYLQLLLFKSEQMLTQYINFADNTHTFYLLDKEKVNLLLLTIKDTAEYTKNETKSISSQNLMLKMKHEAQSMVLYISDLRNKSLELIKQKEELLHVLQEEKANMSRQEEQYEELKAKINRLNDSMGQLVQEVDKKDELIEYLKLENDSLKEDLKNLEQMNKTIKQNDRIFSEEMIDLEQKLKQFGSSINRKDQSINQLLAELNIKEKQINHKDQQIREIQMAIKSIKEDYEALIQEKEKIIQQKSECIVQVEQQKLSLMQEVKDLTNKIQFIEKQSQILQQKIENVIFDQTQHKHSIQNLEEKIILLEKQNMQLYKDIKTLQANNEQYEQNSSQLESQYLNLQKEYQLLLEKLEQNKEQIVFYEREMFQLAKMADTTWYEKLIEEKDARIHQLQRIISGEEERVDQHRKGVYIPRLDSVNQNESREMNGSDVFYSGTGSIVETKGDVQILKDTLKKLQNQDNDRLKPEDKNLQNEQIDKIHLYEIELNKAMENIKSVQILSYNKEIKHLEEIQLKNKQLQKYTQEIQQKNRQIKEKDKEIAHLKQQYERIKGCPHCLQLKKDKDAPSEYQDDDDYIPFLQQGALIVEKPDDVRSKPDLSIHHEFTALVIPSREPSVGDSSKVSNVSHYEINIIDEHAFTVDTQQALHKKRKTGTQPIQSHPITFNHKTEYYPQTKPIGIEIKKPKLKPELSNIADGYDSDDQRDTLSKQTPPSEIALNLSPKKKSFSESDKFEENLTYVSKAMNLDKQNDKQLEHLRDIQQMEDEHKQQQSKLKQIPDIIMAKSIDNEYTDRKQSPKNKNDFFKHVNKDEAMRAELRLSGEKDTQGTPKPVESNRLSKNKIGNVYIKMNGRNNQVMRNHRSNSCYATHF